jgi:glycosyltransferase involved in cell wall biosynthesis
MTGDLPEALRSLNRARELGYQPVEFIEQEIRRCTLRRPPSTLLKGSLDKTLPLRVYLSCITGTPLDESGAEMKIKLGATNYSYAFSMKGFMAALDILEIPYTILRHPEFIPNIADRSDAEINVHIGFYPPDDVRFLKGAYNVLSVAWEFERLRADSEITSYHAFADPARMLGLADEIWSVSAYGEEAFRKSGLQRVRTLPTPILHGHRRDNRSGPPSWSDLERTAVALHAVSWSPFGISYHFQSAVTDEIRRRRSILSEILFREDEFAGGQDEPPIIFLSVFNVHDWRKQVRPLIEAFVQYTQMNRNAYLLLKVSSPFAEGAEISELIRGEQIHDPGELFPCFASDHIWITAEALSRDEMLSLYNCAGFYVCTSHAEGQNLPMLEAMARGVVPVSVDSTAMAAYIRPDNAIVIPSTRAPFTRRLTHRYGLYGVSTWYVTAEDVHEALSAAAAMDLEAYKAHSRAAMLTVSDQFGPETLRSALDCITHKLKSAAAGEIC